MINTKRAKRLVNRLKKAGFQTTAERLAKAISAYENGRMPGYILNGYIQEADNIFEGVPNG